MNIFTSTIQQMKRLWPYVRRYRGTAAIVVAATLGKQGAILLQPAVYRGITRVLQSLGMGTVLAQDAIDQVIVLLLYFVLIYIGMVIMNVIVMQGTNHLESRIMRDAASAFVAHVLHLSFRFHSDRKTGKISKEFARGVSAIEEYLDAFVFNFIPLGFRFLVILVVFLWVDWIIGLLLAGLVLLFCAFNLLMTIRLQHRREESITADDEGHRRAIDAIMNAEAVKYFHTEKQEIDRYAAMRVDWQKKKLKEWTGWTYALSTQIAIEGVMVILVVATMLWRLLHIQNGALDLPNFVFIIGYLGFVIGMLWDFQSWVRHFYEALTDLSAFFSYFDKEQEIQDAPAAQSLIVSRGIIIFDHVTFGYGEHGSSRGPEKIILDDVSFTIPSGKSVAFVGPSGVGKSTIMKLLYRFYDPVSGGIFIDGQNIASVTQSSLRAALAIVPQEAALFNDTVAYNIGYAQPHATRDEIERAARFARIHEFVKTLPRGYDTLIGERGVKLSGGERQRLSIARAVLRQAPILVLDEATSSLDSATEADIQESLRKLMHGRTSLIIAHRLSTIMHADLIIVMNNGGIEKIGTHEELLVHGGLYQRLWELQAGGYIDRDEDAAVSPLSAAS